MVNLRQLPLAPTGGELRFMFIKEKEIGKSLQSFRPIPKANEKNAAMDDLENAKRQQEIENR